MSILHRRYPFFRRTELREQVDREVRARVATLLELTADRLLLLPKSQQEETEIAGRAVAVTVVREDLPDGSQIVAVCANPAGGLNRGGRGSLHGFLITHEGNKCEIPNEILRLYL